MVNFWEYAKTQYVVGSVNASRKSLRKTAKKLRKVKRKNKRPHGAKPFDSTPIVTSPKEKL